MLGSEISGRTADKGLPEDTIVIQSRRLRRAEFRRVRRAGHDHRSEGDANDYFGKGLPAAS